MTTSGRIQAVRRRVNGGTVLGAVAIGALVIPVDDALDFDEAGGRIALPSGAVVDYVFADLDGGTVTLAVALAESLADGDFVALVPETVSWDADVALEDVDDVPVVATVPHSLVPLVGEQIADDGYQLRVTLVEATPGEWLVTDVVDKDPIVEGEFVDPDGMVGPYPTDDVAPASSPTPTVRGGIGALIVTWTGSPNADPVTYEVHAYRTDAGPGNDLVGEVAGTSYWVRALPTGEQVVAGVTYSVFLVAKDRDGPAPASPTVTGTPAVATSDDLAVGSVTAEQVAAGAITAEKLAAMLVLANAMIAGDPSSQHVTIDPGGVTLYGADQTPMIVLPTNPGQQAWFRGAVEAVTLDVLQGLTIRGIGNVMGPGSVLTLRGILKAPLSAPTVSVDWVRQPFGIEGGTYSNPCWDPAGDGGAGSWWICEDRVDSGGVVSVRVREYRASDMSVIRTLDGGWGATRGLARIGAHLYIGVRFLNACVVDKRLVSTLARVTAPDVTALLTKQPNGNTGPFQIGTDGTNVLLGDAATYDGPSVSWTPRVRTLTVSDAGAVATGAAVPLTGRTLDGYGAMVGLVGAEARYWVGLGHDRFVGNVILPWSSGGVAVPDQDFQPPAEAAGLAHDGTRFWSLVGRELVKHTNWNWSTESSRYWVGQTWFEDVATP